MLAVKRIKIPSLVEFIHCYLGIDSNKESEFWLTPATGHVEEFFFETAF